MPVKTCLLKMCGTDFMHYTEELLYTLTPPIKAEACHFVIQKWGNLSQGVYVDLELENKRGYSMIDTGCYIP